jgi:hypothetical protein
MKPRRDLEEKHIDDVVFSSDDEERESIRQQRAVYKNFLSGVQPALSITFPAIMHPEEDDDDECGAINGDEFVQKLIPPKRIIAEDSSEQSAEIRNKTIVVSIRDFNFTVAKIRASIGDILMFELAKSVPVHAEHILFGDSETSELRFRSPLLEVSSTYITVDVYLVLPYVLYVDKW